MRSAYEDEISALRGWTLLGLALAMARYEIEQGKLPPSLEDLLPRYLDAIPNCPHGNEPFEYTNGRVWCVDDPSEGWKVGRR